VSFSKIAIIDFTPKIKVPKKNDTIFSKNDTKMTLSADKQCHF
jgi:hypothetical protein